MTFSMEVLQTNLHLISSLFNKYTMLYLVSSMEKETKLNRHKKVSIITVNKQNTLSDSFMTSCSTVCHAVTGK